MSNILEREVVKYAYGFKSDVMTILCARFNIPNIDKKRLFFERVNFFTQHNDKKIISFRSLVIKDVRMALSYASSEASWKKTLIKMDYSTISMKSMKNTLGKRVKIGINLTTKKRTTIFLSFQDLGIYLSKIRKIFDHNKKKKREAKTLQSHIENYQKYSNNYDIESLTKYIYRIPLLLEVSYNEGKVKAIDNLLDGYILEHSKMYNISTFCNETTMIVDYGYKILLKKTEDINEAMKAINILLKLKKWNLKNLNIRGDKYCKDLLYLVSNENIPTLLKEESISAATYKFIK